MAAIEGSGHRRFAAFAVQVADTRLLGDCGFEQRDVRLVAISAFQPRECGRLWLDKHTTKSGRDDNISQVILNDAIERADLKKRELRVTEQLVGNHEGQAAPNGQRGLANHDRRYVAALNTYSAK